MPPRSRKDNNGLGRAIIKNKIKVAAQEPDDLTHTREDGDHLKSVTHEGDLDEFLNTAQLAATDFTAERQNVKIITAPDSGPSSAPNPYLLSSQEEKDTLQLHGKWRDKLRVPRRPVWDKGMTARELERSERDAFLDWRRGLADLSESHNLLLTPFERNLEVWRQLWRVLERSHLVVQIVDGRNPEGFRCGDLEDYVSSLDVEGRAVGKGAEGNLEGGKRRTLLLINKADLLTLEQRRQWADHFDSKGLRYAFFSALNASQLQLEAAAAAEAARLAEEAPSSDEESEEEETDEEDDAQVSRPVGGIHGVGEINPTKEEAAAKWEPKPDEQRAVEGYQERTRVLGVLELEELFLTESPDLNDFVTQFQPRRPSKLVVGLVGYPNVGKSSTINALLGGKRVSVSATPGKTKHFQTLIFTEEITLCDCPGLVFPQFATSKAELVCDGVLPIDQMKEYTAPMELVCRRVPREVLEGTYAIRIEVREIEDGGTGKVGSEDFLSSYAIARGFTRASFGLPDTSRAARYVLKDYVNAKLLYCHPPPGVDANDFNAESREAALLQYVGKKKAPTTRVGGKADTFVKAAPAEFAPLPTHDDAGQPLDIAPGTTKEQQRIFSSIPGKADNRPSQPMSNISRNIDGVFFKEDDTRLEGRPRTKGTTASIEGTEGFSRPRMYPVQNQIGDDGLPLEADRAARLAEVKALEERRESGKATKKHFKTKKSKSRSGAGYD